MHTRDIILNNQEPIVITKAHVSESKQHKLQERACKGYFECYGERWIQQPEREKNVYPKT